ncbi:hypothetical protein GF339_19055 [candidate division KSB3 bacterium]|uniref:SsuA/THI5-like domain-containing protein n=1 Tax=candidate division KSB3 bacterium TaxID=2044937 RepID=A0A9D5JZ80_9BACT|nr:hypothetical protein [candidate division KSB3 bacterium]MBD3326691.1 hypothetical protein [candidate division KSB3 bacterium]
MKRMILIIVMIACGLMSTQEMVQARTYKIASASWIAWSPAHVADVKGFWEDQGLDVRLVTIANPQENMNLFQRKLVDITFEMIGTAVGLYLDGLPVRILAETDWSHGGDKIIVKQDLETTELQGKPIGVYFDFPPVTYFLNQYLSSIGLQFSDTRIIEMEPDALADHFINDRFGIIVCFDPEARRAEEEGNGKVVATSATYPGSIPEGMIILEDTLQEIPEADLIKIFNGWIKAVEWSQNPANWQEYMEILNTQTFPNDPPYSEDVLREMLAAVRIHDTQTMLARNQDGGGLETYLEDLKTFLAANEMLTKDFTVQDIFANDVIVRTISQ